MTYKDIRENREVLAYLKKGNDNLGTMGFTDHSLSPLRHGGGAGGRCIL